LTGEIAFRREARARIVFLGTPEPAAVVLRALTEAGFPVPLAVTRPDRPRRRGGHTEPSPLKAAAVAAGIPVYQPEDINAEESVEKIRAAEPDVLLIVAFGRILKRPLLEVSRLFPVNLHFSLLPEYRGAAPVARAIADGRRETGVTLQRIVPRLDAGPVLASEKVAIGPDETTGELTARLSILGARLTVETLGAIERGEHEERTQDDAKATKAPRLEKKEGVVDWGRSAREIQCHIRAMTPWPGATTSFLSRRRPRPTPVILLRSSVEEGEEAGGSPGDVVAVTREGIVVRTGAGLLAIRELKPAGKKTLGAAEFTNGYRTAPGDRFGT
jgi:methionyl-tRNA formyltransferase